jgi:hypothetical protein
MLTSGGGFCLAEAPASGKRLTGGGTDLPFSSPADGSSPSQFRNKKQRVATACYEMLRNALKRFGMLWQE